MFGKSFPVLAALALIFAGSGCATQIVDHPLSDEKTSVVDQRLIGDWKSETEDKQVAQLRITIGRAKGSNNTLEAIVTEPGPNGQIQQFRLPLYATSIDGRRYLSFPPPKSKGYAILLYQMIGGETPAREDDGMQLFFLHEQALVTAIEQKELAGAVKKSAPPFTTLNPLGAKYEEIHITAPRADLIAYLKKHGESCFNTGTPILFRQEFRDAK